MKINTMSFLVSRFITDLKTTASIPAAINQPMQSQSTYQPRSKGGALARANGCELVATFTMEVQVRVSCEIFHLTAHFTANHRRA